VVGSLKLEDGEQSLNLILFLSSSGHLECMMQVY
jgi:hypothetical protein